MKNKNFGKLIGNRVKHVVVPIVIDGQQIWTNDPAVFLSQGYYPITYTDKPVLAGYYYTESYEMHGDTIVQVWVEHEFPPITDDTELSPDQVMEVLLGGDIV